MAYALRKNVVLVAPAGDDGEGPGLVDYPAAYPGVIAVGAVARSGQIAPFSSRRSYVSLAAPGVSLMAAVPPDGYARISSTSSSSGIVAGLAALILSRFPHLTVAQVSQALTGGTTTGGAGAPGAGHGIVDAARAVGLAASLTLASQPRKPAAPARPDKPGPPSTTVAHRAGASALAGSLVRYVVAGLAVLIVLLVVLLLVVRSRRERSRAATAAAGSVRARPRGQHEQRRPEPGSVAVAGLSRAQLARPGPQLATTGPRVATTGPQLATPGPQLATPGPVTTSGWTAAGGWQGGSLGEMQRSSTAPFRPVMTPAPKPGKTAARGAAPAAGPPWAPAPEPERTIGPLPAVANSALPPDPGPGIRVPGDMAALPAVSPDSMLPAPFDVSASPDPDFPPRPAVSDDPGPAALPGFPGGADLPTRRSLGFAAAPVPVDYAPPQAPDFTVPSRAAGLVLSADPSRVSSAAPPGSATPPGPAGPPPSGARADPSYIWDLAATDVFPAAADPGPPTEAPGVVLEDDDPGASVG